jgi:hypothetical protein
MAMAKMWMALLPTGDGGEGLFGRDRDGVVEEVVIDA